MGMAHTGGLRGFRDRMGSDPHNLNQSGSASTPGGLNGRARPRSAAPAHQVQVKTSHVSESQLQATGEDAPALKPFALQR